MTGCITRLRLREGEREAGGGEKLHVETSQAKAVLSSAILTYSRTQLHRQLSHHQ